MPINIMERHKEILLIIGQNIKEIRKENGIKAEILAKQLKKSTAAISQMENGLVDFKISYLSRIAELLETDLSQLICTKIIHTSKEFEKLQEVPKTIFVASDVVTELLSEIKFLNAKIENRHL